MKIVRLGFGIALLAACSMTASGQFTLTSTSYSQNFDAIGTSATATLPSGWALSNQADHTSLATATTHAAGTTGTGVLTSSSAGGYYNFANGVTASSTDRAVGFLSSGSFSSPRYLYFAFTNDTGATITSLTIAFDYEKYRSGTRAFTMEFATSSNATSWTSHEAGGHSFAGDANNTTVSNPPIVTAKSLSLNGLEILAGTTYYLRWSYIGSGGSTNAQALGVDNFSLDAVAIPEPSTYAAIFGGLALIGVIIHRRRKVAVKP